MKRSSSGSNTMAPAGYTTMMMMIMQVTEPGGRLSLLSARPTFTFPAAGINALDWYQIILLGDRGTQV